MSQINLNIYRHVSKCRYELFPANSVSVDAFWIYIRARSCRLSLVGRPAGYLICSPALLRVAPSLQSNIYSWFWMLKIFRFEKISIHLWTLSSILSLWCELFVWCPEFKPSKNINRPINTFFYAFVWLISGYNRDNYISFS